MSSTIRRAKKDADNPYCTVRRATFEDKRLSWEARGLLAYLLVKPDDWQVNVTNLVNQSPGGRDRVYRILKELIEHHYIQRNEVRDGGKIVGYEYLVFEEPYTSEPSQMELLPGEPDTENTDTVEPLPEKPDTVLPDTENTDITKKEELLNKKTTKNIAAQAQPEPPQKKKRKEPEPPEVKERRAKLKTAWLEASQAQNYTPAQVNTGIKLLDLAGCTPEELVECHQWIKEEPFYALKTVYPQTIFKRIDEYRRYRERAVNTYGGRNNGRPPAGQTASGRPAAGSAPGHAGSPNGKPGGGDVSEQFRLDEVKLTAQLVNRKIDDAEYERQYAALRAAYGLPSLQRARALPPS